MISGKATREFVRPMCDRGEFEHHARQQASIGHSHRIHIYETAKQSEASRARGPEPPPNRKSRIAASATCAATAHPFIREQSPWEILAGCAPPTYSSRIPSTRTPCTGGGTTDPPYRSLTYGPTRWGVGTCHLRRLLCAVPI